MKHRVAVVTDELVGINRGGGIGTCAHGLIRILRTIGCNVDVIITDIDCNTSIFDFFGSQVIYLSKWISENSRTEIDHASLSYAVYEILKQNEYDVVHFNDWRGSGFYYAMAKKQGAVEATVVTHTHGPTKWVKSYNNEFSDIDATEISAMEFSQIENSDYVVSPSQYLLEWYKERHVSTPNAQVINWVLPSWLEKNGDVIKSPLSTRPVEAGSINEIVFFGRQERRKGFELFISAIKSRQELNNVNITFLGRFDRFEREFTGSRVFRLLPNHRGAIRFLNDLDNKGALSFLENRPNSIAVMPSLIENSPCVVGECFTIGIPFVTTAVGGIPELFKNNDYSEALVENSPAGLADRLVSIIHNGMDRTVSALEPSRIVEQWIEFHSLTFNHLPKSPAIRQPLVSVCLVHHNRTTMLRRALNGLAKQTYENFEVILVDDGSKSEYIKELEAIEAESWPFNLKLIKSKNKYLGAARNLAAQLATGEFLIFHDDDNLSECNQIEVFINSALNGSYDILTSQYYVFNDKGGPEEGTITYFPMGIGGAFSYFRNRFGDANALIKKSTFHRLGGFSELRDAGWEDWEFFLKAYLSGAKMGVVPEPLFRYRVSIDGMLASTSPVKNNIRLISVAGTSSPEITADLLQFAKRESVDRQILDHTWATLGRAEFANNHQEFMALDPNSDEARHKLMELAFAMRRDADAIDLGLGLRSGFYRVSEILKTMGQRTSAPKALIPVQVKSISIKGKAIAIKGWIASGDRQSVIANEAIYNNNLHEVIEWTPQFRQDVNNHLNAKDNRSRGFLAIAAEHGPVPRRVQAPFSLRRGLNSEKGVTIRLSSNHPAGKVDLRLSSISLDSEVSGYLDELVVGQILELSPPSINQDAYLNRIIVTGPPNLSVYIYKNTGGKIDEIIINTSGFGEYLFNNEETGKIYAKEFDTTQIFVPGNDVDLSATFYFQT